MRHTELAKTSPWLRHAFTWLLQLIGILIDFRYLSTVEKVVEGEIGDA
jgi:hypothetical protein